MRLFLPFASALLAIALTTLVSVQSLRSRDLAVGDIMHAYELRSAVGRVLSLASDAETGQRGYLLTGRDEYLLPYLGARKGAGEALDALAALSQVYPAQGQDVAELRRLVERKLAELNQTIDLYRRGDTSRSLAQVEGGEGRALMEQVHTVGDRMIGEVQVELNRRRRAWEAQAWRSELIVVLGAVILLGLSIAAAAVVRGDLRRRDEVARERTRIFEYQERLISIVGHDLRNPLSAILISSQSLLDKAKNLSETQVQALQRVRRSAGRINALAGLLIDFTHARLGRGLPVSKARVDARELVEKTVDELRGAHPGRTIEVENKSKDPVGLWDGERLAQLVVNLVANALRYGREDAAVTVTLADAPQDMLELRIHNHGNPIPAALLPSLFEPYQRGPNSSELHQGGLGLGLFIVREIVRSHGGSIEARSRPGDGTTFLARLPRGPKAESAVEAAAAGAMGGA